MQGLRQDNQNTVRRASAAELAQALADCRADTLATFAKLQSGLAAQRLNVPALPSLNLPLWELGHVGWFQDWWISRFTQRPLGHAANPDAPRLPPRRADADALYDSTRVEHASRWALPLPLADSTRDELAQSLASTQWLLAETGTPAASETDAALYFFRLVLLHEDMHHEAALYTAQALGIDITDPRWQPLADATARQSLHLDAADTVQGWQSTGFAFDNELAAHAQHVAAFSIDSRAVNWGEFLPFVEAGGYEQERWWSGPGRAWLAASLEHRAPRDVQRNSGTWLQRFGSHWLPLDPSQPACHLNAFEAEAWCHWAGRRLPTEAEWEHAAGAYADDFRWGQVWEWTASAFAPYAGFVAHPYREYSAPWFNDRQVLRGASFMTQPRMKDRHYRNFFTPERQDVAAGFRSCAV